MVQSIQAMAPSSIGDPVTGAGVQLTPSNGFSTLLLANCQHSSPWSWASTLTQNALVRTISW